MVEQREKSNKNRKEVKIYKTKGKGYEWESNERGKRVRRGEGKRGERGQCRRGKGKMDVEEIDNGRKGRKEG